MSWKRKHLLLTFSAMLGWMCLAFWVFSDTFLYLPLEELYSKFFGWIFLMMTFAVMLMHMDTEIKNEADGQSWTDWGDRPRGKRVSSYESYQKELRRRMGR